jgi:predicted  nucleic acid-binding Zn-ribbon protein
MVGYSFFHTRAVGKDMLQEALKVMLDVQELDIQMIRLTRMKRERLAELDHVRSLRDDLRHQVVLKESEVIELKKQVKVVEGEVAEISSKAQKLETQQNAVRKVEEFNALTHEISLLEREKAAKEQRLSTSYDNLVAEEDFLKNLKASFEATKSNSDQMEKEIKAGIEAINQEGREIMVRRTQVVLDADKEILAVYEKLLQNKRDRVIVPIENRCCSGCHIVVTAQHENLVRKGEKLIFCEHCSRVHYWHERLVPKEEVKEGVPAKRRKRVATSA